MSSVTWKPLKEFQTEKARGIAIIARGTLPTLSNALCRQALVLPHDKPPENFDVTVFARPCPTVARHGFVDSQPVYAPSYLNRLLKKLYREDSNGECILMPHYPATYSGVATAHSLTIGFGTDGATSGKRVLGELTFPGAGNHKTLPYASPFFLEIKQNGYPYLEFLFEPDNKPEIVQLRNGVPPIFQQHFMPFKGRVGAVIKKDTNDLLKWEERILAAREYNDFQRSRGSDLQAVVMFDGDEPITGHFAVHCMMHNVAFMRGSLLPKELEPTAKIDRHYCEMSAALRRYTKRGWVREYLANRINPYSRSGNFQCRFKQLMQLQLYINLIVAHNSPFWQITYAPMIRLVSFSMILYVIAATMILLGELRHANAVLPKREIRTKPPRAPQGWIFPKTYKNERESWQLKGLWPSWEQTGALLDTMLQDFRHEGWPPEGNGNVGGPRWAAFAETIKEMHERITAATCALYEERFARIYDLWHKGINMVHNGDLPMTSKFLTRDMYDAAFQDPVPYLLNKDALSTLITIMEGSTSV